MICCDLTPLLVPSPEAEQLSNKLKYIALGHLMTVVLYLISMHYFEFGLMDLILAWLIFISFKTFNHCYLIAYVWFLLIAIINAIAQLGKLIQFEKVCDDLEWACNYMRIVLSIVLAFYFFSAYITYKSYREFKALALALAGNQPVQQNDDCINSLLKCRSTTTS